MTETPWAVALIVLGAGMVVGTIVALRLRRCAAAATPANAPEGAASALSPESSEPPGSIAWLLAIMQRLLGPGGCPWDQEQTLASLKPFLLEECYEVLEAIDEGDPAHHREELGDLLYQIVFQTALAGFSFDEVVSAIGRKLIHRHPHVFGELRVKDTAEVLANWETLKAQERKAEVPRRTLDGIPRALPALMRAQALAGKAAKKGFSHPAAAGARADLIEELAEADAAIAANDAEAVAHELGDLLFALANWSRLLGVDAEEALRQANTRFHRRFTQLEAQLAQEGKTPQDVAPAELLRRWAKAPM